MSFSKIAKKVGQLSQWTGEKFGTTQKTEVSEEFKELEQETAARKEAISGIVTSLEGYYKQLSKAKGDKIIVQLFAEGMQSYGELVGSDSGYGPALITAAKYHERIAKEQAEFAEKLFEGYLLTLHNSLEGHKEYKQLEVKLNNRRLDFDSKLNKVQKSKKEDTVLEEETRVAQSKYEETLQVITDKMIELNRVDEYQHRSLLQFIDYELEYYKHCAQLMEDLKRDIQQYQLSNKTWSAKEQCTCATYSTKSNISDQNPVTLSIENC